jgi:beta-phosphoglucomutase-like phosphatase (HAD superfamily)
VLDIGIPCAIGTSGRREIAPVNIEALGVDEAHIPIITRDQVKYAKPNPALFLTAAARLNVVVGDAIWDMLTAGHALLEQACCRQLWTRRA